MLQNVLDLISEAGFAGRPYHGRCMPHGRSCVAVVIDEIADIALFGPKLRAGLEVDRLALRFIAYWPDVLIPDGHELMFQDYDRVRS